MRERPSSDPPRWVEWLLARMLPPGAVSDSIVGDLREEYARLSRVSSVRRARAWYRRQALGVAARAAAGRVVRRAAFGSEASRVVESRRGDPVMATWSRDTGYALRGLVRSPQFTAAAALTLGLAIGANAAIFSVVQGVLLRALPYDDSDRLVAIHHSAPGLGYDRFGASPGTYLTYRSEGGVFETSGLLQESSVNLTGEEATPDRVGAGIMARDVFLTLGTAPLLGRFFTEDEDAPGRAGDVVVLSEGLWRERFGGDPGVLGASLRVDGRARTVVGVMPASFEVPDSETRLWLPLGLDTADIGMRAGQFTYDGIGRLRDGVSPDEAAARLSALMPRLLEQVEMGDFGAFVEQGRLAPVLVPLKEEVVGNISRPLWILLGTVGLVFLIACANVTNLFLVRSEARQKEMAVRAAMGAHRGGLIRLYLVEAGLIAAIGGLLGLGLAWAGLGILLRSAPPNIPRLHHVGMDPWVLLFVLGVTAVAALLLAVLPAARLTSPALLGTLSRSGRGATASRTRNRARQLLVVAQTALALVLLVGSGLMVRSYDKLRSLDPGFEPAGALTFRLTLPESRYDSAAVLAGFHEALLNRLRALPGVEAAGAVSHLPLSSCCSGTAHVIEDRPIETGELPPMFWYSAASAGYFEAMRIPLLSGRTFDAANPERDRDAVIVSRELADRIWRGEDPIGRRMRLSSDSAAWRTIVGVVGNVRDRRPEDGPSQMVYYPTVAGVGASGPGARSMSYVVRAAQPDAMASLARREVWAVDGDLPIAGTMTLERVFANSMVNTSFTMLALVVAAAIALILGAIGLYGVISYLVTQRTNEIGIRLAIGARPAQVRRMVVMQGARLMIFGLVIGFLSAAALTRLMQGLLFETRALDPLTFLSVSAFLAGVAMLASYLPARRASRIDPASSLRTE